MNMRSQMKIVAGAAAFTLMLAGLSAAAQPTPTSRPAASPSPGPGKAQFVMTTYTYKTVGNVKIDADVYRPDDDQPRPVLVWLHGGALMMGARKQVQLDLMDLCRSEGYCLVSADYRLAPQAKLPQIIEDLHDFMKWVSEDGPWLFNADANRVVVAGNSAGGYLTMMTGIMEPRPKALVAYYGYGDVDGPWYTTPSEHYRKQPLVSREDAYKGMTPEVVTVPVAGGFNRGRLYLYLRQNGLWTKEVTGFDPATEKKKLDPYCPVRNITPKYPPLIMLHGTADTDVPCQESLDMAEQLKKNNVRYEMFAIPGAGHGLGGGDRQQVDKAMARAREFIRENLDARPAVQPMSGPSEGVRSMAGPVRVYDLEFSTYLGGSSGELLRDMTVDAQGNVYVAGIAGAADFPRTPPEIGGHSRGGGAMVAKFSPAGKLIWSKVIGALGESSYFYSVKVDKDGGVFVAGRMGPGFPTTPGAFQPKTQHNCGFVGKLKPDGSAWVWASYVGAGYAARDMTMDDKGDIYCILDYFAESQETLPAEWFAKAYQKTPHGGGNHFGKSDAGVIKISNDGNVLWATWIGGTKGNDWVASLGVDANHCPVLLLRTLSKDMPTTPGATGPSSAPMTNWGEGWLGKLSADGSKLIFGTYIANAAPRTHNLALDGHGNIFICTCTKNWPVTPGAFQTRFGGGPEDFGIAKFSPAGRLLAATYLGGNGDETNGPDQIFADSAGNVVVAGSSSSTDFPVTQGAFQPKNAGAGGKYPFDGIVSVLSNDLSTLVYSTCIGGTGDEMARACCVGADGTLYAGGVTTSRDFPVKNAYQEKYGGDPGYGSRPNGGQFPVGWGNGDCWIAKFRPVAPQGSAASQTKPAPRPFVPR